MTDVNNQAFPAGARNDNAPPFWGGSYHDECDRAPMGVPAPTSPLDPLKEPTAPPSDAVAAAMLYYSRDWT